jgi:geranylgeranyl reductase family protein
MIMHDVIVVGAGPSGSMAASMIASKGFSVQLIERKKEIGHPVQCAEAITEFCLQNVNLPKKHHWIKRKVNGVKILLPNDKCFYSTVPTLCINRSLFDKWLAERAVDSGAILKIGTIVHAVEGQPGDWAVKTTDGTFNAKILIGADGPLSKTATWLGLIKSREYTKALQYKFDIQDVDYPEEKWLCMYMNASYKGGYGWVFPRGDEYNIGVGGPDADVSLLNSFCKSLDIKIEKKKESNAGLIPFNFNFETRAREGVMIVGDAAGMTNPATGGGIHAALFSGKAAGEITIQALESENLQMTKQYDEEIKKTPFLHPIHLRTARYFHNWTNKDWGFFGEAANGMDMADLTLFKSFLIGLKYPRYLLRARELLTIRKEMQINQKYGF